MSLEQDKRDGAVTGAVRIGRSGTKLHPATRDVTGWIHIHCACGGTNNGNARKRAQFFPGVARTCRV